MSSTLIAPGVYFDLEESKYHADPALGSTDIKKLVAEPADYWWHSVWNPARPEDTDTPARALGRAVHCAVLYGLDTFRRRYGRCEHPGNIKAGKEERESMEALGREPMRAADYDRVLAAATIVKANPKISDAFSGGAAELSVFWEETVDGEVVRRKARFDYLRPRTIVDLKSHAPSDGLSFITSCLKAMKTRVYYLQAAAYLQALPHAHRFAVDGQVEGDVALARHLLGHTEHGFSFVFWASAGAPLTWPTHLSQQNGLVLHANGMIAAGLQRFVDYRREFGTERAWIKSEPVTELSPEEVFEWHRREAV